MISKSPTGMKNLVTTLLVGIGSPHGDDRIGWEVAKRIQGIHQKDVTVRLGRTPSNLLDWLEDVEHLVICDACRGAGKVGSVHHWTWPTNQLETLRWSGTHDVSLPAVLALAEQLGKLPTSVIVWAIEVSTTQPGDVLSVNARPAITTTVDSICRDLGITSVPSESQHA
jgi:hydrogenase maturation protease